MSVSSKSSKKNKSWKTVRKKQRALQGIIFDQALLFVAPNGIEEIVLQLDQSLANLSRP